MGAKKTNPVFLLAGAVFFGVIAIVAMITYINNKEDELRLSIKGPKVDKIEVVVAKENLPRGVKIGYHNMMTRVVPNEFVHPSAITLVNFDQYDGKVLTENLPAGKPLLASFVSKTFPKDFSDTIPVKRRAMTIQVDDLNSIAGLIRPGNFIDLFALFPGKEIPGSVQDAVIPVLQNLEVLATGDSSSKEHEEQLLLMSRGQRVGLKKYTSLTVNVTPKQAALLATARDKGDLIALLRNRKDKSGATFTSVEVADLLNNAVTLADANKLRDQQNGLKGAVVAEEGDILLADGTVLKKGEYTVDRNGNIVTKDGKVINKHNVTKLKAGQIVTGNGKVLDDKNLIVKNGVIMTKDGIILSGRGLSVNDNGDLVDEHGNVVDTDGLKVSSDGSLVTKDGIVLSSKKMVASSTGATVAEEGDILLSDGTILKKGDYKIDENGNIVTKSGEVIDKNNVTKLVAGQLVTKEGIVLKTGKKPDIAEEGDILLADGTVLKKGDYTIDKNGNYITKDGKVIEKSEVTKLIAGQVISGGGPIVAEDGDILLADGTVLKKGSYTMDENGNYVTKDGRVINKNDVTHLSAGQLVTEGGLVVNPEDIVVMADGTIMTKNGEIISGLKADKKSIANSLSRTIAQNSDQQGIEFLAGGNSKDGVAEIGELPVLETK